MRSDSIGRAALSIVRSLSLRSRQPSGSCLVMLSGLPGTGKSTAARWLGSRLDAVVVESDAVRRALVQRPVHDTPENVYVFAVIHRIIDDLLSRGLRVILDATNLVEQHRRTVYAIAERRNAPVFVLRFTAPDLVVQKRLHLRHTDQAGWVVYQRMRLAAEPIQRDHMTIDTSGDTSDSLERVALLVEGAKSLPWRPRRIHDAPEPRGSAKVAL